METRRAIDMVREFHDRQGVKRHRKGVFQYSPSNFPAANAAMQAAAGALLKISGELELLIKHEDPLVSSVAHRFHLMIEELGEHMEAVTDPSLSDYIREVRALDGLADLKYVVEGTADVLGMPLDEAVEEVHRSNMTKAVRDPDDPRVRMKGEDYSPPDLGEVIRLHDERTK